MTERMRRRCRTWPSSLLRMCKALSCSVLSVLSNLFLLQSVFSNFRYVKMQQLLLTSENIGKAVLCLFKLLSSCTTLTSTVHLFIWQISPPHLNLILYRNAELNFRACICSLGDDGVFSGFKAGCANSSLLFFFFSLLFSALFCSSSVCSLFAPVRGSLTG